MMKLKLMIATAGGLLSLAGGIAPDTAQARHYHHYYRGRAYYARDCRGGNGAVGTIGGGVGGALIGNAVLGGPVGTIAGGVGGALLGRHLDKAHTRHEHGC
ncbi:MAG: hypothetical protein M3N34_05500 [Pseudomonadota bacterium]|nr:hypothetical protein [Pseudomonadota bacterium]